MAPRTLGILLVLVLGLGAFVWFFERERPGTEERETLAKRVLGVEREEVRRLELRAGDRTVELVRVEQEGEEGAEQDVWRITKPLDFAADYWQVDGLVRSLAELERERELDEFEPAAVGLDAPRGRVVVELEGGERKELLVGAAVPASENLIVAVEGEDRASVVPAGTLWESIDKDAAEWREKDLFAAERDDVRAVTLELLAARGDGAASSPDRASAPASDAPGQEAMARALGAAPAGEEPGARAASEGGGSGTGAAGGRRRVRLERVDGAGGEFRLVEPIVDRADDDAVSALLRELTGLRATEFVDDPPPLAELGLDPPAARLEVTLEQGEPFVLLWGARREGAEETYARVGDLVVTTAAALDESLGRATAEWRSKEWSSLPIYDVDRVNVTDATGTLELVREEGSWRRGEDTIEQGSVSDFLYAIDEVQAERIVETGQIALAQPELTITFATAGEDGAQETPGARSGETAADSTAATAPRPERLELFAPAADGLVPARSSGREAVLLLPRTARDEILGKLEAVRASAPATDAEDPAAAAGAAQDPAAATAGAADGPETD